MLNLDHAFQKLTIHWQTKEFFETNINVKPQHKQEVVI